MRPKYKNVSFFLVILLLVFSWSVGIAQDKVGTSAAPFLGINIGGAASALGGAYVSMATDASALYWNPGAISRLGHSQVNFTHTSWFVNTDYNWAGVVLNLGGGNALGFNLAILDYGEDEVTTVHQPDGTGERWNAQDLYAAVSYARNLTDRFSIGGSMKLIQQKIYNESATGYAVDVGLLYFTRFNGMRLGMSISNFGTDMQLDGKDLVHSFDQDPDHLGNNPNISSKLRTVGWPLPLFYRVGASMDILRMGNSSLMMLSDAVIPSDNSTIINVGGEFNWNQIFFLRAGYKSLLREDTEEGLTAGLGIKYFVPGLGRVSFDYAYNDYGLLEQIHVLGLGFSF
ncbi:MAG TPA: PorV/PorQ family protein [Caldithrix sp.]|nr:PorV/PorQ family protein [Caldithrix sp.]